MTPTPAPADADLARGRERFLAGVAAFEAGRHAEAEAAFRESLEAVPGRASTLANLGAACLKLGRAGDALAALDAALAQAPDDAEAWSQRGFALAALGRAQPALQSHERAIAARGRGVADSFGRANALAMLGRVDEALAAYDEALALAPRFADAWSRRGSLLHEAGRLDEAAAAWRRALDLGADPDLHRWFLAAVGGGPAPDRPPPAYVEALFDEYAAGFGEHLVRDLGYRAPARLCDGLDALDIETAARLRRGDGLDLGCGSGLCAPGLAPRLAALDGIDLSARMLEEARKPGLYRDLVRADLVDHLAATERRYALVVAADVLNYLGDLAPVFAGVRRVLVAGGVFAFTVESPADPAAAAPVLGTNMRYAHPRSWVERLAAAHGLDVLQAFEAPIREEQRRPVAGAYVYLRVPPFPSGRGSG